MNSRPKLGAFLWMVVVTLSLLTYYHFHHNNLIQVAVAHMDPDGGMTVQQQRPLGFDAGPKFHLTPNPNGHYSIVEGILGIAVVFFGLGALIIGFGVLAGEDSDAWIAFRVCAVPTTGILVGCALVLMLFWACGVQMDMHEFLVQYYWGAQ